MMRIYSLHVYCIVYWIRNSPPCIFNCALMTKWKNFSLPRSFDDFGGMAKFCVNCGNMAAQEAYSMKIWLILIERNTVTHVQKGSKVSASKRSFIRTW
jgi:hypothetical protein